MAALWTSMLFVFAYVDPFSLYRADVRSDIEVGELGGFTIGQSFLFLTTVYIAIPSLMLSLSVLLPVRIARLANIIVAALYVPTIAGSAFGEWNYYILGSVIEIVLLAVVIFCAWSWPRLAAGQEVGAGA